VLTAPHLITQYGAHAVVPQVTIGRLDTSTLALADLEVSATHLILRWLEPDDGSTCCWQV
jgi:hypothetical protein